MPQGQFDELTGALGRQALSGLEQLTRELESSGYGHAVAMLDVDHQDRERRIRSRSW